MPAPKEEKEVEFKASRFRSISMQEFDLMKEHLKVNASPLQREQYQSIESRASDVAEGSHAKLLMRALADLLGKSTRRREPHGS